MLGLKSGGGDRSPQDEPREKKRRRKALSCAECKRRKLKCDRLYPACSRCIKSDIASTCNYDTTPGDVSGNDTRDDSVVDRYEGFTGVPVKLTSPPPFRSPTRPVIDRPFSSDEVARKFRSQEDRIRQLEERLANLEHSSSTRIRFAEDYSSKSWAGTTPKASPGQEFDPATNKNLPDSKGPGQTMVFKGKGFKTQFYGPSHPGSLNEHFTHLNCYMRNNLKHQPMIIRLRKDLLSLGGGMKRPKKVVEQPVTVGTLLMLLPSRDEVEPMVHLYIDAFEATYRILHVPSFWTEYSRFWEAPHDAREGFVVTLLAVLAIVACAVKRDQYSFKGSDSVWRDKVLGWVAAADFWVQNHSHKHLTITFFQIHCLVLLAKRSNHIKKKRAWIYAQAVFNLAMSAGMHREPSYLGTRTSIFEKEMRRRLWATICELELHASVERGMIPSSGHAVSDTLPPLNIDDENFNENSDKLPHPKPAPISTRTLYLSESCKTQQLRISLTTLINNPKRRLMEQEAFAYEEDVTQCIEDLANTTGEESFPSLARSMLDLQLRQYLLLLRRPLALKASTRHIQNYSRLVCLNTATRIINEHSRFMKQGSYTLRHLRDDMFGASLNICLDLLYNDPKSDHFFSQAGANNPEQWFQIIDQCLSMMETDVMRLGVGSKYFWILSSAYSFVRGRLTSLYYKILSFQSEPLDMAFSSNPPGRPAAIQADHPQSIEPSAPSPLNGQLLEAANMNMGIDQENGVYNNEMDMWLYDDIWNF